MADDQTSQQTRVLLVNGQTIILQGDAGDNSINEINADLLQQALQEVSTTAEDAVEEASDEYSAPIPETEDANDNLVAIFQGVEGETQTIRLTVEQAEALGLHFSVDDDDKPIQPDIPENGAENSLYMSDEQNTQLVYSDEAKQNCDEVMFENELDTNTSCADMVQNNRSINNNRHILESSGKAVGALSAVSSLISDENQPITLIPQFVDGQMTYTVKIQEDENEGILQNRQFTNMDSELKSGSPAVSLQQTNVGVTLSNIASFVRTPLPSISSSASTSAPISTVQSVSLPASPVQQSVTLPVSSVQQSVSLPIISVQQPATEPVSSVKQSVSVPVSSVQQTVPLSSYQCSRTSGSNVSVEKQAKVSYVILPGNNTSTSSSVTTKLSNTPLERLSSSFVSSNRNESLVNPNSLISTTLKNACTLPVVLSTTNSAIPTQVVAGTNSGVTGIPAVSSNTNAISSTSILASVASSTSAGGMIRVVAGGTTNRTLQPIINSNTNKFTSILAPSSGRLIATTSSVTTPKIVSINPSSVSKTPTTATPEVSNMVSAALTRMPVPNFNSTKPLGSSENPIQLVQHGQTFHR
jgi:hypothetical protein